MCSCLGRRLRLLFGVLIGLALGSFCFVVSVVARTDSRPCAFRPPSWRPSYFLLLVQEKVTKENTPSAPRRSRSERFAKGERVFSTGHPWPVEKIGAIPRAARVRGTRLIRSPFAAALEGFESESTRRWVPAFAGTTEVGS